MGTYYLDIETTGLEPGTSKIVTIQYVPLERGTGRPLDEVTILKEWELGERGVLERLIKDTPITDPYGFAFVPVGFNLRFERKFLLAKSREHGLRRVDVWSRPWIDLQQVGILMNRGEFKGASLDRLTSKPQDGSNVPGWYAKQEYGKIERYVRAEADEFIRWYQWLLAKLPELRKEREGDRTTELQM